MGNCGKNCKCHENHLPAANDTVMCKCVNKPDFYLGIDDVTMFKGKKDNMVQVGKPRRYFTQKFHNNPKRAVELVYFNQVYDQASAKDRTVLYDPETLANFWKNVHYDPAQRTYFYDEYLTLGTYQHPKQCQLEHFYRGEYEFIKLHHEIQVLKTELVKA